MRLGPAPLIPVDTPAHPVDDVDVRIRPETPADHDAVRDVHLIAFAEADGRPDDEREAVEAGLTDRLREGPWYLPELSLVAEEGGRVVGHVICTRADVGGERALGLGPIGVLPDAQNAGIGSALVNAAVAVARDRDERLIGLLGDPNFYGRFGIVDSRTVGVEAPDPMWGVHFQVLALDGDAPRGTFRYATPFDEL